MAQPTRTKPAHAQALLTLSTVVDRKSILIDGTHYDLINPDEIPWLMYRDHANVYREAGALLGLKRRTEAQNRRLEQVLPQLVAKLLPTAPASVLRKLSNAHRLGIVAAFSDLLLQNPRAVAVMAAAGRHAKGRAFSKRTGAK